MEHIVELYNLLKGPLGEEGSKAIINAFEEVSKNAQLDYREDLKLMATKGDLLQVKTELEGKIERVRYEIRIYFLIVLIVMLTTNPHALDLLSKLINVVK